MWLIFSIVSALFLGSYDLFNKASLNKNAVIPVLFFSTLTGAVMFMFPVVFSALFRHYASTQFWYIPESSWHEQGYYFLKSVIVGISWMFSYFAVKHLPITIASPIRASAPMWTLIGAITIFGERLSLLQWAGLILTIFFYFLFSLAGNKEGIDFRKNKWVWFMLMATLTGVVSALYDKFLIAHFNRLAVQAYSDFYLVLVFLPALLFVWYPNRAKTNHFQWRNTIPMISISLLIADCSYFYSLSCAGSLLAIISVLRRSNVVISFSLGAVIFKETNMKSKSIALVGILVGLVLVILGSQK
ncbi:MAG: EamA family transporter [Bacteroidota bacterium]|nr:EamA family transporter [Bacteroidota bacterium]